MTPPPKESSLPRLTWWTKDSVEIRDEQDDAHNFEQNQEQKIPPLKSDLPTWKVFSNHLCGVEMLDEPSTNLYQDKTPVVMKSREEMALEAAESLWEPAWKKIWWMQMLYF